MLLYPKSCCAAVDSLILVLLFEFLFVSSSPCIWRVTNELLWWSSMGSGTWSFSWCWSHAVKMSCAKVFLMNFMDNITRNSFLTSLLKMLRRWRSAKHKLVDKVWTKLDRFNLTRIFLCRVYMFSLSRGGFGFSACA